LELRAAFSNAKPVFPVKTTGETSMTDSETFYGFTYNGVIHYDAAANFQGSMEKLVRDMKAISITP
jgi:hypothetical protein